MGLVKEKKSLLLNQNKEYIYCDFINDNVLISNGVLNKNESHKKIKSITDGNKLLVNDNQCLIIVQNGKILDFTVEPGKYIFNTNTDSLMNYGNFGEKLIKTYTKLKDKITQDKPDNIIRAYFINTNCITGNKFSTSNPISYDDKKLNFKIDIKCYGVYTIQVTDPIKFYYVFGKDLVNDNAIDNNFKTQFMNSFLSVLEKSLLNISDKKISYDMLPEVPDEISKAIKENLNTVLKSQGIDVLLVSIASATPTTKSMKKFKKLLEKTDIIEETQNFCPKCNKKMKIKAKFCSECGTRLVKN